MGLLVLCFGADSSFAASGVDAWQAVMTSEGIELRDYLNRPISRDALQRELRAGARKVEHEAARTSALPGLGHLLDYLDRKDLLASALRTDQPAREDHRVMPAIRPLRSPKLHAAQIRMLGYAPADSDELALSPLQLTTTPGRVRVQVLLL